MLVIFFCFVIFFLMHEVTVLTWFGSADVLVLVVVVLTTTLAKSFRERTAYRSPSAPPKSDQPAAAARPVGQSAHVRATPDMASCLTVPIRGSHSWEKTDSVALQIGASGVKLQEYANYLNWSAGRFFLDKQFHRAADRVTRIVPRGPQTGRLQKWKKEAQGNFFRESNYVGLVSGGARPAAQACKQCCFSWFNYAERKYLGA